jgi:nucleotide-binding universal stress UspA family protein
MATGPFKSILAPVDLSSCSRAALELACKLATPFGASVDVIYVHPANGVTPAAGPEATASDQLTAAREELHRFVASIPGVPAAIRTSRVETGDARERIVAIADGSHYDAIVLGTHGRTGRPRSLAGSVAESVVRTASCPVITVREPR